MESDQMDLSLYKYTQYNTVYIYIIIYNYIHMFVHRYVLLPFKKHVLVI